MTNVVAIGNASPGNVRKAQMLEHIARKIDAVMDGDDEMPLSITFVVFGHPEGSLQSTVSWDLADAVVYPVSVLLNESAAQMLAKAAEVKAQTATHRTI